ncbi:TPA: DUF2913 family protein [Klebsiella oxytoca]|uniref:DUF2913 family protein n=1 Tax=Klebsiella oxytoca TaxID=571 RepID=A0AAN5LBJ0_KLEOX|nr:DUF2913 family protein [Klebsiella oxytoca]
MKKSIPVLPSEHTVTDPARLAWCALVSLRLAQQDGRAQSSLTVHTFLLNWLATAQKQRRFPRTVVADIDRLLRSGRQKGPAAGLQQQLESLWQSCTVPVGQPSELLRLTYAIGHLKATGWLNAVVTDEEWVSGTLRAEYADVPALLVRKSALTCNFGEDGRLSGPVEFLVTGAVEAVTEALNHRALRHDVYQQADCCHIMLLPECN